MTHYTTDYSKIPEQEKAAKALKDIRAYLGDERFEQVEGIFRKEGPIDIRSFAFNCSMFLGIEGYPVTVWHESLYGKPN